MPIRNPFTRRPSVVAVAPDSDVGRRNHPAGFERVDTVGSKASSSVLSIRSAKSHDTGEYKMSVVNDSGVYLPVSPASPAPPFGRAGLTHRGQPSPPAERAQWPRRYLSRASSDTRSSSGDIEHFSISRESFDSYRRSFDISARSPVAGRNSPTRQSLDSPRLRRPPRSAPDRPLAGEPPPAEDCFEDIGLDDHKAPRRRGFFPFTASIREVMADSDHGRLLVNVSMASARGRRGV